MKQMQQITSEENNLTFWNIIKWNESLRDHFLNKFRELFVACQENFESGSGYNSASDTLSDFLKLFHNSAGKMLNRKKPYNQNNKSVTQPDWWNITLDRAKKAKYQSLRQFRRSDSENDFEIFTRARNRFKEMVRDSKTQYQRENKQSLVESHNDPKSFWKTIKQSTKSSHKRISTDSTPGDEWYNYFKKLLNSPSDRTEQVDNNILENIRQENDCEILNRPITELEVREGVFSLPSNKSPGPDGICSELYKVTLDYICPFLCKLCNELLDKGEAPQCFSESILSSIHKKRSN